MNNEPVASAQIESIEIIPGVPTLAMIADTVGELVRVVGNLCEEVENLKQALQNREVDDGR